MSYRPPKGVRPPALEGKRSGRPKGSRNCASGWRDAEWGYWFADEPDVKPPTGGAAVWRLFAMEYPEAISDFLESHDII